MNAADSGHGVRIAASHGGLASASCPFRGSAIAPADQGPVQDLDASRRALETLVIGKVPRSGKSGKHVVHAEHKTLGQQVAQKAFPVIPAPLQLHVITLVDIVDTDVNLGAAGHATGDFLAQEEVRVTAQAFTSFDRVMVCHGDEVHAQ
jgi:hypothetical protein